MSLTYLVDALDSDEDFDCSHHSHYDADVVDGDKQTHHVRATFTVALADNEHFRTFICDEHLIPVLRPAAVLPAMPA